jgi:hypothetical protein
MSDEGKIYVARTSGVAWVDGKQEAIIAGTTRVREGHALLAYASHLFQELDVQFDMEDARVQPKQPDPAARYTAPAAEADVTAEEAPVKRGPGRPRKDAGS